MKLIKKIKQNGILFIGAGLGISGIVELVEFTEPSKSALEIVGLILMALPFTFYIYDWIKSLKKRN